MDATYECMSEDLVVIYMIHFMQLPNMYLHMQIIYYYLQILWEYEENLYIWVRVVSFSISTENMLIPACRYLVPPSFSHNKNIMYTLYIRVNRFWSLVYPDPLMGAKLDSQTYLLNTFLKFWAVLAAFGLKISKKC